MEHDQRHHDRRERAAKFAWLTDIARDDNVICALANVFVRGDVSYDECLQHIIIAMAQRHHGLIEALARAEACKPPSPFVQFMTTDGDRVEVVDRPPNRPRPQPEHP